MADSEEWSDPAHVGRYLQRAHAEEMAVGSDQALLEQVPAHALRFLDLGIREATAEDWPTIWSFFGEIVAAGESFGYDTAMSEGEARAMWLDGPPSRSTVATDDSGAIVGSANMHANRGGPGAHVASATYMVDPTRQGRGAGRALVEDSLAWALEAGFKAMQFNAVVETNERAVGLYESLGFAVVGTVPEAFAHPRHGYVALHVMHRKL